MIEFYPRDLCGYGSSPPKVAWPNGGKVAISLVLNFEEGAENCILHGDTASEAFLSEIVGASAWSGQRHWNMESIYDYGARAGFWRLYAVLKHLPITVYGVATALARAPEQVQAMKQAPWEIACHGYKWIEYKDFPPEIETEHIHAALALHREVIGHNPVGWYTGRCSMNTVQLAAKAGKFKYISDSYADDLPYWVSIDGTNQLILPYTLDANDMRFSTPQGFNCGDQFFTYLKDSLDTLIAEGNAGYAKMMSIGLHCRLIGRPGRFQALQRFIDYAHTLEGVWFATREQIADHWIAHHQPAMPKLDVTAMGKNQFVKTFGSVFEHSPWVAEQAYLFEKGPAHNSVIGIHSLLCRAFRRADDDARLAVLRRHPDLAGKLAIAKTLTPDSTAEQASAGLDVLSDDERAKFNQLNQQYVDKFSFPFIIAVRDNNKNQILEAFHNRLSNSQSQEFSTACTQVERIAELRLEAIFND